MLRPGKFFKLGGDCPPEVPRAKGVTKNKGFSVFWEQSNLLCQPIPVPFYRVD